MIQLLFTLLAAVLMLSGVAAMFVFSYRAFAPGHDNAKYMRYYNYAENSVWVFGGILIIMLCALPS